MRFISLTATVYATVMLISSTKVAGDFIAWSGNACNGDEGLNEPCDNSCGSFDSRHSFEVIIGGSHCVTLFEGDGCTGEAFLFEGEGNSECINVNTGTFIGSYRCSADNTCTGRSISSISTIFSNSTATGNATVSLI
ncbi:hypothetical protein J3R30DRAFT_1062247 [Lentinula aciculospora]|uniref:Uncharacterized protein n=1 Tax=Lentinula aciculospora TaxID=153920 RepID=A0A9W9DJM7_9AGAR|nr:hypothetical protein J3R30DRAFT_1062247 [Lentinula aciculospora]